jgi:hypothetical protein
MKTFKKIILVIFAFLIFAPMLKAQRFGTGLGIELKKPLFITDSITKGTPAMGINAQLGFYPDDEGTMQWNFYFSYFLPSKDSVAVEVEMPFYYYNDLYDAALVTTKSFSAGLSYEYTIPHNISSLLYLGVGVRMGIDRYRFEYDYTDPIKTLSSNINPVESKGFLNIGAEITPYYDLNQFYLFAKAYATYRLSGDEIDNESHFKIASTFNFGLRAGLIFFFD